MYLVRESVSVFVPGRHRGECARRREGFSEREGLEGGSEVTFFIRVKFHIESRVMGGRF